MRQQRPLSAIASALVLLLVLSGCGGDTKESNPPEASSPAATASVTPSASPAAVEPSPSPQASSATKSDTEASAEPAEQAPMTIKGTGTYVGQIDNHSVEIETEDGPTAFELGAGTEKMAEQLNMDERVVFEYTEEAVVGDNTLKQRVLTKLEPAK